MSYLQSPVNTRSQVAAAQILPDRHPSLPKVFLGSLSGLRGSIPLGSWKDPRSTLRKQGVAARARSGV